MARPFCPSSKRGAAFGLIAAISGNAERLVNSRVAQCFRGAARFGISFVISAMPVASWENDTVGSGQKLIRCLTAK